MAENLLRVYTGFYIFRQLWYTFEGINDQDSKSRIMNPEIFTTSAQELINRSIMLAQERKNPSLLPLHTLAAGLDMDFVTRFFSITVSPLRELQTLVTTELNKLPIVEGGQLTSDYTS